MTPDLSKYLAPVPIGLPAKLKAFLVALCAVGVRLNAFLKALPLGRSLTVMTAGLIVFILLSWNGLISINVSIDPSR
jgi:hypothetical protein